MCGCSKLSFRSPSSIEMELWSRILVRVGSPACAALRVIICICRNPRQTCLTSQGWDMGRRRGGWNSVRSIDVLSTSLAGILTMLGCSDPHGGSAVQPTPTSAPSVAAQPAGVRRPHLWILSIGVSQYRDRRLRWGVAAADAQAFADVLKRQEHWPALRRSAYHRAGRRRGDA